MITSICDVILDLCMYRFDDSQFAVEVTMTRYLNGSKRTVNEHSTRTQFFSVLLGCLTHGVPHRQIQIQAANELARFLDFSTSYFERYEVNSSVLNISFQNIFS